MCPRGAGVPRVAIDDNRAHITVLACVTMAGGTLDPMFIVKGKTERIYPDIISKLTHQHVIATGPSSPPVLFCDTVLCCALIDNAWITAYSFTQWMEHIFIPSMQPTPEDRVLLLVDNHTTHFTFETVKLAYDNGVDMFPLPRNSTHILQPLDVGVFGLYKKNVESKWAEQQMNGDIDLALDRITLINTISDPHVWKHSFGCVNVMGGWKNSGLFPFNPSMIQSSHLTPDVSESKTVDDQTLTIFNPRTPIPLELHIAIERNPDIKRILTPPIIRTTRKHRTPDDSQRLSIFPRLITPEIVLQLELEKLEKKNSKGKKPSKKSIDPPPAPRFDASIRLEDGNWIMCPRDAIAVATFYATNGKAGSLNPFPESKGSSRSDSSSSSLSSSSSSMSLSSSSSSSSRPRITPPSSPRNSPPTTPPSSPKSQSSRLSSVPHRTSSQMLHPKGCRCNACTGNPWALPKD